MFDFEKLIVYKKIVLLNRDLLSYIYGKEQIDEFLKDQLKRASISVALNLAEGTGRISLKDKRHFFVMSRASVHESVALIQVLRSQNLLTDSVYNRWYFKYEEISKMLLAMIKNPKEL
jgi:four helix bundle protein